MPDPSPVQYDTFADAYREHAEVAPYNALYDRPAMLELLGEVRGRTVFDAGCGPGIYTQELLDRGARVQACDASPRMVELARERVGQAAGTNDLRVHSLEAPIDWIEDGTVDLVLCALVYHYITDRPGFLAEMHRVLRPGGALLISTHHPTCDWLRLGGSYFEVASVTETWSKGWEVTAWRMPLGETTAEFADAGFLIERLVETQPAPEMAQSYPKQYAKLTSQPNFVNFRLLKR